MKLECLVLIPYLTACYYLAAETVWVQAMKVDEVQSFASLLVSPDFLSLIEKQNKGKLHSCVHQWKVSRKSEYPKWKIKWNRKSW